MFVVVVVCCFFFSPGATKVHENKWKKCAIVANTMLTTEGRPKKKKIPALFHKGFVSQGIISMNSANMPYLT